MSLSKKSLRGEKLVGLWMGLPALIGLAAFIALPFLLALIMSFTNLRLGSPLPVKFVGFEQYYRILTDPSFQRALFNNLLFAVIVVPVQTCLALALAMMLNSKLKGISLFRTLFFMPVVFPMALIAVVWTLIYAPGPEGMMNSFLMSISGGYIGPQDFLHNKFLALPAIMLLSVWQGVGFQMIILLAGLQAIPPVLYEAAVIDRAGKWSQFFHVTLPQLRNPLIFTALVTTILSFRLFDQVQIMTQGGPGNATTTIMYEAVTTVFQRLQVAQASAMTVVFFLIVVAITVIQRWIIKEEREIS